MTCHAVTWHALVQGVLRCVASALGQSCAIDFYSGKANVALQWSQGACLLVLSDPQPSTAAHAYTLMRTRCPEGPASTNPPPHKSVTIERGAIVPVPTCMPYAPTWLM